MNGIVINEPFQVLFGRLNIQYPSIEDIQYPSIVIAVDRVPSRDPWHRGWMICIS